MLFTFLFLMVYYNRETGGKCPFENRRFPEGCKALEQEELFLALGGAAKKDPRELNPLQMAYIGDTVHDLFVRSSLMRHPASVGKMHKQAVRMVSAAAQAQMLRAIEEELTEAEADVARRGRNAQAKHAAPKNADPADYAHATGLEALWGYLFVTGETQRLAQLVTMALERTKDIWQKRN